MCHDSLNCSIFLNFRIALISTENKQKIGNQNIRRKSRLICALKSQLSISDIFKFAFCPSKIRRKKSQPKNEANITNILIMCSQISVISLRSSSGILTRWLWTSYKQVIKILKNREWNSGSLARVSFPPWGATPVWSHKLTHLCARLSRRRAQIEQNYHNRC